MNNILRVTAFHMIDNLSTSLYSNHGQCLAELVRNSLVASMPSPTVWKPDCARIEIKLESGHPLCNKKSDLALTILDHGCGLTDPALDRYFNWLGTPLHDLHRSVEGNGASQKGIGRLAALALNTNCLEGEITDRVSNGFYLFTRTSSYGKVRFVRVIPEMVESAKGFDTDNFIDPNSTEMGSLKDIKGTFTALVIPTPVFSTAGEIVEALKWYLPREQDKMFSLTINGKPLTPPRLEEKVTVTSADASFRAYLGLGDSTSDGAWLCDEATGFRVASCQQLGRALPEPLWYPDLRGDIFAPGLLKFQNTSRSALARDYVRRGNKQWSALYMFLINQVVPKAKQLMDRDLISGDASDTLNELVEMFNEHFGPADGGLKKEPTERPTEDGPDKPKKPGPPRPDRKPRDGTQRYVSIKVRDETYHLYRGQSLHPFVFAQLNPNNSQMVYVNIRGGYQALPPSKAARREHCLMQVLQAIGQSKFPLDQTQALRFANEIRGEFLK